MKLSFSTLGCPQWSLEEIMQKAGEYGYDGIELRGIKGEMSLPKCPEFAKEKRKVVKQTFQEKHLEIACVDTSARLSLITKEDKENNLQEVKLNLELAADLGAKFIRVFGGGIPEGKTKEEYFEIVGSNLKEIAREANKYKVYVLVETHDSLVLGKDISAILEKVNHPYVGVVWDINHPYRAGEKIEDTFQYLKKHLRHIHLKDTKKKEDGSVQLVLTGEGDLPVKEILDILKKNNYSGYLSYEWEKVWQPEIEEPEVAFPIFAQKIKKMIE